MRMPHKGNVIIADAEPHAGHEMGGHNPRQGNIRRHYVVMSTDAYSQATGMFVGFPITTVDRHNNPRYLPLLINGSNGTGVKGYVVLWQLQNFDFQSRHGTVVNHLSPAVLKQLQQYVNDIVG
ncbi:type II toxin-antitoxin system PemK/MazF family toxin [uncultured Limosilactobacillus sp.]|uniref:type II toxin-antitoxin system PemK/MazF family toxin n=1 Tax=uncultured Limosilactobacillus sp. TaxID=2837629 RepID=UPI0025DCA20F|nr:type II toxin-antitoxin system PemK/MazF family toxin [uncultured Limosilactobacillus sp.]